MAKNTLIYIFEPLDGWCYGFGPIIQKLQDKYAQSFDFDILSAGLIVGNRIGPLANVAGFIKQVYKVVEQNSEVKFGSKFINETLAAGKVTFSSLEPSKALTIFKQFQPEKAIVFSHDIQKLIFSDGIDPVQISAYLPLFERYGISKDEVLPLFALRGQEQETINEFGQVHRWGIKDFPTVILQMEDGKAFVISSGFTSFPEMEKRIQPYLS